MKNLHSMGVLAALLVLVGSVSAKALEYPCPSDPGFCYFDVGNDGCFDSGADVGPIDSQLESGEFPSPLPPGIDLPTDPGSIICPPRVGRIDITAGSVDWRVSDGSDVLLYRARLDSALHCFSVPCSKEIAIRSGGRVLLGGGANLRGFEVDLDVDAAGDVILGRKFKWTTVHAASSLGDVLVLRGMRTDFPMELTADVGEVIAERATFAGLNVVAGGTLDMTDPRIRTADSPGSEDQVNLAASDVVLRGSARFKVRGAHFVGGVSIVASPGDLTADRLDVTIPFTGAGSVLLSGRNVTIGLPIKGKVRPSKVATPAIDGPAADFVRIEAAEAIAIEAAKISAQEIEVLAAGTDLSLTRSKVQGLVKKQPDEPATSMISGGAGSTCNLTGTNFTKTALTIACDTVVGP